MLAKESGQQNSEVYYFITFLWSWDVIYSVFTSLLGDCWPYLFLTLGYLVCRRLAVTVWHCQCCEGKGSGLGLAL